MKRIGSSTYFHFPGGNRKLLFILLAIGSGCSATKTMKVPEEASEAAQVIAQLKLTEVADNSAVLEKVESRDLTPFKILSVKGIGASGDEIVMSRQGKTDFACFEWHDMDLIRTMRLHAVFPGEIEGTNESEFYLHTAPMPPRHLVQSERHILFRVNRQTGEVTHAVTAPTLDSLTEQPKGNRMQEVLRDIKE